MNNIVVGLCCFGLLVLLLGMAVPLQAPLVKGVYGNYPAAIAGVPPDSVIRSINGTGMSTREEVSVFLNNSRPGDNESMAEQKCPDVAGYIRPETS